MTIITTQNGTGGIIDEKELELIENGKVCEAIRAYGRIKEEEGTVTYFAGYESLTGETTLETPYQTTRVDANRVSFHVRELYGGKRKGEIALFFHAVDFTDAEEQRLDVAAISTIL